MGKANERKTTSFWIPCWSPPSLKDKTPYRTTERGALLPLPAAPRAVCFPVMKTLLACCLSVLEVPSSAPTTRPWIPVTSCRQEDVEGKWRHALLPIKTGENSSLVHLLQTPSFLHAANVYEGLQHTGHSPTCQANSQQSPRCHRVGGDDSLLHTVVKAETWLLEKRLGFPIENWTKLSETFSAYRL